MACILCAAAIFVPADVQPGFPDSGLIDVNLDCRAPFVVAAAGTCVVGQFGLPALRACRQVGCFRLFMGAPFVALRF